MNFYVSLVFIGIFLIVFSLIWVILDKKKSFGFIRSCDEKKNELIDIINDAEQMINELNKFSDYIVTQMESKNEELVINLKVAEENIKNLGKEAQAIGEMVSQPDTDVIEHIKYAEDENDRVVNGNNLGNVNVAVKPSKASFGSSEKVIHLNNKYTEVIRLAKSGMNQIDIAKKLNVGKGEIELILGINRN